MLPCSSHHQPEMDCLIEMKQRSVGKKYEKSTEFDVKKGPSWDLQDIPSGNLT